MRPSSRATDEPVAGSPTTGSSPASPTSVSTPPSSPATSRPTGLHGSGSWNRVDVSAYTTMRRTSSSTSVAGGPNAPPEVASPSSPPKSVPPLALSRSMGHLSHAAMTSPSSSRHAGSPLGSPKLGLSRSPPRSGSPAPSPFSSSPRMHSPDGIAVPSPRSSSASELARRALNSSGDLSGGVTGGSASSLAAIGKSPLSSSGASLGDPSLDGPLTIRQSGGLVGWTEYQTIDGIRIRRREIQHYARIPYIEASVQLASLLLKHQDHLFKANEHDKVPQSIYSLFEHIINNGLAVEDLFSFHISRTKVEPLFHLIMNKGMSLPDQTNIHVVAEMLRLALERLPRKPINFNHIEPSRSFIDMEGDNTSRVKLTEAILKSVDAGERQLVGLVVGLLSHLISMSEINGVNEGLLLHMFAPLLVDGRWLVYRAPPTVRLPSDSHFTL